MEFGQRNSHYQAFSAQDHDDRERPRGHFDRPTPSLPERSGLGSANVPVDGREYMHRRGKNGKEDRHDYNTPRPIPVIGDRSLMDRPMDRLGMERPGVAMAALERPGMERPGMVRPGMERPGMDWPSMDRPGMDRPGMDRPDMERSAFMDRPDLARPTVPYMERPDLDNRYMERQHAQVLDRYGNNMNPQPHSAEMPVFSNTQWQMAHPQETRQYPGQTRQLQLAAAGVEMDRLRQVAAIASQAMEGDLRHSASLASVFQGPPLQRPAASVQPTNAHQTRFGGFPQQQLTQGSYPGETGRPGGLPGSMDDLRPQPIEEDSDDSQDDSAQAGNSPMEEEVDLRPKHVVYLRSCVLYPPPPRAAPVTARKRGPGCRTIFIGGLPKHISRDILNEVFMMCNIDTIHLYQDYAYIHFHDESSVEKAMKVSGFKMWIRGCSEADPGATGLLHTDYASNEEDRREWERQQQAVLQTTENMSLKRPGTPPSVVLCMKPETLLQKLKSVESFGMSVSVLRNWLQQGRCDSNNTAHIFQALHFVSAQMKALISENERCNSSYLAARQQFKNAHMGIVFQFEQIQDTFSEATKQKNWDNFTKPQRKKLETWRKQCQEHISAIEAERIRYGWTEIEEENVEAKDAKRRKVDEPEVSKLKKENDTLKCQLEAYRNEVELLKLEAQEAKSDQEYEKQLKMMQNTVKGMQQQLIKVTGSGAGKSKMDLTDMKDLAALSNGFTEWEARIISLVCNFLSLLPTGASIDYILTYIQHATIKISRDQLHQLMTRCPSIFQPDTSALEERWKCVAFSGGVY